MRNSTRRGFQIWALLALVPTGHAFAAAAPAPGMTWDSIRTLPDLSGPWNFQFSAANPAPPGPAPQTALLPSFRVAAGALAASEREGVDPASVGLERYFCRPPRFTASNKNDVADYFEILFTPGRVTVTNELGLIRRIRLGNGPLPAEVEPSNAGTSIARWEGDTLVVETTGLHADTVFQRNPALKFGRGARVIERIRLVRPDVLEVTTRLTAPELLVAPYETTVSFGRNPDHQMQEFSNCVEDDRSYDNKSGREKFDLTPPPDLPPPPGRKGNP